MTSELDETDRFIGFCFWHYMTEQGEQRGLTYEQMKKEAQGWDEKQISDFVAGFSFYLKNNSTRLYWLRQWEKRLNELCPKSP